MRVSLPAIDKAYPFHLENLALTLSATACRNFFFGAPLKRGAPRYLNGK